MDKSWGLKQSDRAVVSELAGSDRVELERNRRRRQNNKIYMDRTELKKTDISCYTLEMEIGRGASGTCYRAKCIATGQVCAIKKIAVNTMKTNSLKLAMKEVAVLKSLNHPHIIKYFDSFADDHHLYIVMEYAAKGDLHALLKKRKLKQQFFQEQEIWNMCRQLLEAFQYLHNSKIVHRDVKTLNIFMGEDGSLLLGDLGVSKILKNDMGLYSRVGTPLYLAPEIIKYEKYDYKADVWGLGCVLYLLATLSHPFEGKNIITLGQNILHTNPKPMPSSSPQLQSMIFKMLEKDPSKRPDAKSLLQQLKSVSPTKKQQIPKPPAVVPERKDIRRVTYSGIKMEQKEGFSAKKLVEYQSQRKIVTPTHNIDIKQPIIMQPDSQHFKIVLPLKETSFKLVEPNKPFNIRDSRRDSHQKESNRKDSIEDTIILKPSRRFYQYCVPNEKTQLRSSHKNSYQANSQLEQSKQVAPKMEVAKNISIDDEFSEELQMRQKSKPKDNLFMELVKNKVRTEGNKKIFEQRYNSNIIKRRDIQSAAPVRPVALVKPAYNDNIILSSSGKIPKEAMCVNISSKIFFNQERKAPRPQSSMGRKNLGQGEIKYIRKKANREMESDNTKTQLLKKPQMILL